MVLRLTKNVFILISNNAHFLLGHLVCARYFYISNKRPGAKKAKLQNSTAVRKIHCAKEMKYSL